MIHPRSLFSFFLAVFLLGGCQADPERELRREQFLLGTLVEIKVLNPRDGDDQPIDAAFAEISRIEGLLSPHRADSDVSRFNRLRPGKKIEISPDTALVLVAALQLQRQSGGAFDPGLGALIRLWNIEGEHPRIPNETELEAVLGGRGMGAGLRLSGNLLSKTAAGVELDLGAIGKGYAVDRAVGVLRQSGIRSASINVGGDLYLLGAHFDRPWRIAIQDPRQPGGVLATLEAEDQAVVTSGDYERYFEKNGIRYHHLFDPVTGHPARRCQSVTVLAPSAMLADGLATAVFILGPKAGLALLQQVGLSGVVIDAAGVRHVSHELEARLTWH